MFDRSVFLLVLLLLLYTRGSAQQQLDFFEPGVRIGANYSNIYFPDENGGGGEGKFGLSVGGFTKIRFSRWIALQAEAHYSQKGEVDFELDYLEIPLVLKVYPLKRFNVHIGPQLDIMLLGRIEGLRIDPWVANTALSLPFGIEYEFDFGLLLNLRTIFGLTNVLSTEGQNVIAAGGVDLTDWRNINFHLSTGWRF